MSPFTRELFALDRRRLDLRAGTVGAVVVAVLGIAIVAVGPEALAAVMGALVVLVSGPPAAGRSWASALIPLIVGGTALTYVAVTVGAAGLAATLVVGAAGVVGALHAGRSDKAEVRALVAMMWIILAFTLDKTAIAPLTYAVAFAVGGCLGAVVALVGARRSRPDTAPAATVREPEGDVAIAEAALRGGSLALATLAGFTYFPDHPAWIAITTLLVMRPTPGRAVRVGAQRALGTGVGVIVAVAVAELVGDRPVGLVLLLLASAFLMMAAREVNYALFAVFATTFVVYSQRILGVDAATSGRDRFLETVIGVAIALVTLKLIDMLSVQRSADL